MPAAEFILGKLALGIGFVFLRSRPHPLAQQFDHDALDRVPLKSGQHAAQPDHVVARQQFDLAQRIRVHLAFIRSFELELTC